MGTNGEKEPNGEYDGKDDGEDVREDVRADDGNGRTRAAAMAMAG